MPLTFLGFPYMTMGGAIYHATGSDNEQVTVEASFEVIQRYGENAVLQTASNKYDRGQTIVGNKIVILPSDFP